MPGLNPLKPVWTPPRAGADHGQPILGCGHAYQRLWGHQLRYSRLRDIEVAAYGHFVGLSRPEGQAGLEEGAGPTVFATFESEIEVAKARAWLR